VINVRLQVQNKPIFYWCVYNGREIEDVFLRCIPEQPFRQSPVLRRRSRKENRPNISAHTWDVGRLLRSINGGGPAAHRVRSNFLPERNGAIFSDQATRARAEERKRAGRNYECPNLPKMPW